MGLEKFGIIKFYNKDVKTTNSYTMKKRYEDFVVKEINEGVMCDDTDIISAARCKEGIDYLHCLLKNSNNETKLAYASNSNVNKDSEMLDSSDITIELGDNFKVTESNITHSDKPVDFDDYNTKDQIHLLTLKNMPKAQRTVVHQKIKLHPMLYAKTNNDSSISVFFGHKKLRYKFTLKKTNRDSLSACQYIAKSLSIPFNNIKYSGNKDKRAITYQNVSVDCVFINLYNLAIRLMQEDSTMNIFDIRQCSSHLKLGELEGNRFTIAIRAINDKADFDLNFKNLENGFYNYFGQQRFGMAGNNHIVGKYLLEKNYEGAINTIMQPCDKDSEKIRKIKNKFAGSITDIDLTEKELKGSLEGRILLNRMKGNSDSLVFKHLHNELSKLYFHAYQSYKFNCLVNETENEYIEQEKENSKHLKGNKRIVVEKARDVEYEVFEDKAVVSFTLNPGVFATMALREVIGDDVFYSGEIQ